MNESLQAEDPTTPNEYPLSKDQVRQGKNITLMHRRLNEDLARQFVYFLKLDYSSFLKHLAKGYF
jgi:hypothetical protein